MTKLVRDRVEGDVGSRRLCTSRLHSRRLDEAAAWLQSRPPLEEILLIADRRRAADEMMRRLALANGGRLGVRSTTSRQLAAGLALAAGGRTPLSPLGAEAIVARALDRCRLEGGRLEFFEPVREAPGFLPALVSTLGDLRLAEIAPDRLEVLDARGRDLARLLTAYTSELDAFRLADTATLLSEAMASYERRDPAPYASILCLDPQITSALEARWFGVLATGSREVLALVPTADSETIEHLEREFGVEAVDLRSPSDPLPSTRLGRGRAFLFERDLLGGAGHAGHPTREESNAVAAESATESATEERPEDTTLAFFSAPGEGQEAVEIARRIHQLARQGVAFERMAILLRNPTLYQPLVEAALDRGGIPAYYSRGVLRPDPTGRALLALLDCATEGLSAHRFAEYLSFGQVPDATEEGRPPTPEVPWVAVEVEGEDDETSVDGEEAGSPRGRRGLPDTALQLSFDFDAPARVPVVAGSLSAPVHWEQLLVEAAVVEGEDRWRRRLAGLEAEMRRQLEASEEDGDGRAQIERSLLRLQHLERFALPLIDELSRWPTLSTWEEWLRRLESLAVRALRRPERVLQVLAELRPMAEVGGVALGEV
ncbi:MAG: hypothetical protein K8J08_01585, partial [Thermoanaerobaculia bacterium]|nr:hypothetical protein [Thermoanaerobaculia bacterium]